MRLALLMIFLCLNTMCFNVVAEEISNELTDIKDPALRYWAELAMKGHKFSQSKLAKKYDRGDGITQNWEKAAFWYEKAAEQGVKTAQLRLGEMYENGEGLAKSYSKAFYWYKQAAENDYYLGLASLGRLYEHGKGVQRNIEKAMTYYKKALTLQPSAPTWIKNSLSQLEVKYSCISQAETTLFMDHILCSSREDLRLSIAKAGGKPIRESNQFWFDIYNSKRLMSSSKELQVGYTRNGEFALAEYRFPAKQGMHQFNKLKAALHQRYGKPSRQIGTGSRSNVSIHWKLNDGIEVKISRDYKSQLVILSFKNPKAYKTMYAEIQKAWETSKSSM